MKSCWHFRTISGKGGAMILPFPADFKTAMAEAVASLGDQVIEVY